MSIDKKFINTIGVFFLFFLGILLISDLLRKGMYSPNMGMNIAIVGDDSVALMLIRPEEDLISWIDLPSNLKITIYKTNAVYPITSLWNYGSSEKKPFEVFERSLGAEMGVAVPKIIKVDGVANIEAVLGGLYRVGLKTDLSLRDRVLIRRFVSNSVESKKVIEEIIPNKAFDPITEPDGKIFLTVNSITTLWTNSKFILEPILSENADVIVNNLSGISGNGFVISKQIESAGIRVIEVKSDDKDTVLGSGCIFAGADKFPISEKFLTDHLLCKKVAKKIGQSEKVILVWLK